MFDAKIMEDNIELSEREADEMEEPTKDWFEIPSPNLPKFEKRWQKLIRRATKLGVPLPTYHIFQEEPRAHKVRKTRWNSVKGQEETYWDELVVLYHFIKIEHPLVQVAGWEFVASLEHTEEGNIVHNISGQDLPHQYRNCDAWCDHCQLQRNRKDTFVVRHENLIDYKQIGRNCLSDFLGVDGTMYANMAEIYHSASELAAASEAEESESWGSGGGTYDYLDIFLSHVAEVISLQGWVSRKIANQDGKASSSDIAYLHMHPSFGFKPEDRLYGQPSDKSVEMAETAIAWCESLTDQEVDNNEYLHNIRIIAKRGIIGAKQYGYAASIVSAYQRSLVDQTNKAMRAKQQAESKFVGEIGKRQNFTVMVEKVLALDAAYGTSYMHIMKDMDGNRLTWFSSSKVLDTGIIMTIKATPKKHEVYKDTQQTILNRCTVVE